MKRVNKRPVDHFEGKWEKGKKYTLYALVKNNGTLFRSLTPKEKDEPYVIYDSENETFSANPGWEIVEMSEDSRLSAMGGNGGGASGQDGKDAGFGTISASVANTSGNPSVAVETSGPDTAKNIFFKFFGLKGNQGIPGVNNADIKVVDALPAASAQTTGRIYLVETETANIYARWYTEVDGSTYAWRQLGTTEVALEDYATKDNLSQLRQEVTADVSQLEAEVSVNGMQKSDYAYSHFTARETNSESVSLGTDILLTTEGDYIEIKTKSKMNGYILRRPTSSNQPCIRYSAQNTMQVRFNSSTNWTKQDNALDWNEVQILKVYLDSISGTTYNFKMYVNDTLLGTQAVTDPKGLNQVVYGGNTIDMDVYYIETKIGGVVSRLDKFAEMTGATYVTDVYTTVNVPSLFELDERVSDLEADMDIVKNAVVGEDMYFRFVKQSVLSNIQSHFEVFQRIKGNIYARQTIGYYIYSGSQGYPNGYWRLGRTNICTLIDGEQTTIQAQAITAGENEFVLKWLAGSGYNFSGGFSGGFHYGETIDNVVGAWVEFVADGNRLSTDADIPVTPCKSFYYREYSPIYQHNDDTIAAWHLKETEFKDGGYETINDVKFVQALDYFAYPGIVCVSRWLSEYAMPEGVATITDMGDGSTTIAEQFKSNGHRIHYEGNGYMCDVESEVLIGADDAQCQRVVYNSSAYNKYYRRNPDTVGSTSNRLKGRTKVKISAM